MPRKWFALVLSTLQCSGRVLRQECMQALLQEGMRELLKTAGNTSAAEPWPCVHALNVLCQAFNDRHLALDISGFCAEGERHCQCGNLMQPELGMRGDEH